MTNFSLFIKIEKITGIPIDYNSIQNASHDCRDFQYPSYLRCV